MPQDWGKEDSTDETATAHARAGDPQIGRGRETPGPGQAHRRGGAPSRDHRVDLAPLAQPVRRDEGRRRQGAQGAAPRERTAQEDRGRPGSRHRHAQGVEPGKLLTPDSRRRAVGALQEQFGVSERRACAVVGQPRSTQRLPAPIPDDEELALRAFLRDFSRRRPRWGWRRAARAARDAGWRANDKRIHRLWIAEGLRVPYRKRKRPLRGIGVAVGAFSPIKPGVVWALDFVFDQTSDGRMLKLLNVIDEYTREALAIEVERSIDADAVVACLERLAAERGAPAYVRFDYGPELLAYAVADWCRFNGTDTVFIDPGSPWQNAWIESFNGRLRDEYLNGQQFDSLLEAQVLAEDWRIDYNLNRPHSAHGWLTPVEFVEAWLNKQQLQLA